MLCTALCVSYIWQRHVLVYLSSTADEHKHNSFFPKSVFAKTSALSCQLTLLSAQTKPKPFTFQSSITQQKHVDWIKCSPVFDLQLLDYPLLHLVWYIDLKSHKLHSVVLLISCNRCSQIYNSNFCYQQEVLGRHAKTPFRSWYRVG